VVGDRPVLLLRQGARVHALADRCNHRSGPLHEGDVGDGTITCPLHGSRFRLDDGSVEQGPATYPQPVFETRVTAGEVEVRRPD
jgi:nitrite reductase/ring-hydroxylating ferredoxin subunit